MGPSRTSRGALALAIATAALGASACGGAPRQDADEPRGSFKLEVTSASFPRDQQISERQRMRITVRNADSKTVPNVALTVKTKPKRPGGTSSAFGQTTDDSRVADGGRPVWIVDRAPEGGITAYTNTWALGRLKPGQSKTFEWRVTPVVAGSYAIEYEANPALDGRARLASGSDASGTLRVEVDDTPSDARVSDDGEVVRGE